jgi:hypothetical protein
MNWDEVEIRLHYHRVCHRCDGELLLSARARVTIDWVEGQRIPSRRTVTLCPQCHRDLPEAQGLLAFFALYSQLTRETVREATVLIREWLSTVTATAYTDEQLAEDIRRWEAGEM